MTCCDNCSWREVITPATYHCRICAANLCAACKISHIICYENGEDILEIPKESDAKAPDES
jgi:hypothetical protein